MNIHDAIRQNNSNFDKGIDMANHKYYGINTNICQTKGERDYGTFIDEKNASCPSHL
ncbi:hypothetical protein PcaKH15_15430 [Parageobacillus caldoxylosilyticus]|nr:hypothetical protein PcaKH15_15430 [Parageobacillus caldoxylosilyticus]BDG39416.1 hypothetical protein PcaKH16_15550 [Parageobacillus caldoxylosilyticus]BDG43199.1 hypothetical protein PcaKH35_15440 [Parageobacillus caldoxylosilyticus]